MNLGWLASIAGWAWFAIAGGGGGWLLVTRGPWPPQMAGLHCCPALRRARWSVSGRAPADRWSDRGGNRGDRHVDLDLRSTRAFGSANPPAAA